MFSYSLFASVNISSQAIEKGGGRTHGFATSVELIPNAQTTPFTSLSSSITLGGYDAKSLCMMVFTLVDLAASA